MVDILHRKALSVAFIDERNDTPPYLLIVFDGEDAIRLYVSKNSAMNMLTELADYAKRVACKCAV